MPGEGVGEHLAGELQVGLDHLGAGDRAAPPGRQPVGGAEQGDVGADRLGRSQVLVDRAPGKRALVDQEAEAQVVHGESL